LTFWLLEAGAAVAFVALLAFRLRRRVVAAHGGRIIVVDAGRYRELWLCRGKAAALQGRIRRRDPLVSGVPYTDGFHLYPPPRGGAVLFVGAGAGVGPRQLAAWRPDVRVTVVDPDAELVEVARAAFGSIGPVELADGRAFLDGDGPGFDLIVVDAFGPACYPGRLATVEAFERCRARLRPGGVLAVNLAGRLEGPRLGAVVAGIAAVFGEARTILYGVPLPAGSYRADRLGNTLAFAFVDDPPPPAPPDEPRLRWLPAIAALRRPLPPALPAPLRDATVEAELPIA
jgi:SAM-dependent methyltransferase